MPVYRWLSDPAQPCYFCHQPIRFARKRYPAKHAYVPVQPHTIITQDGYVASRDLHHCHHRW